MTQDLRKVLEKRIVIDSETVENPSSRYFGKRKKHFLSINILPPMLIRNLRMEGEKLWLN